MNYSVHSFFLKKSLSESINNHFSFVKEHAYYLFYEEKENYISNTEIFPNTIKIQTTSIHPRRILYEFSNFFELATKMIQKRKQFPIYAILPTKLTSTNRHIFESSFKLTNNINRSMYPLFSPFQSVYYVSFIEQFPPKPQRKTNVLVYYNFFGYESNEDLDKAFDFLENNTKSALPYYKKYHEGYSYVDFTNDPKEAYLFYNSL